MTLPLQQSTASTASAAPNSNSLGAAAAAQNRDKVTSPNPIIDSVKSYDSDKTLSGMDCEFVMHAMQYEIGLFIQGAALNHETN